ncbi:hypothetical protein [Actinacidiphila sp. bgisy145]|uniref:hypothetical protein n=1 Tax=Actinacidiphila sp. bgisy145 TaxID=3413792 RepID=UPI003EBF9392
MLEAAADLALSGATTVVAAMATDAWAGARDRLARLFGRSGGAQQASLDAQLEGNAALVAQAEDAERVRAALVPVWQLHLAGFLREHPEAADELRVLLSEIRSALPEDRRAQVQMNVARDNGRVFAAQGGDVIVHQAPENPPGAPGPGAGPAADRR